MLYNKKSLFFRKITAKIVGNSSPKRKGEKCHKVSKAPSSHHHHQGDRNRNDGLPLLIAMTATPEKGMSPPLAIMDEATMKPVTNKPKASSGLLAAKLKCDEWGLQSRANAVTSSRKVVPSSGTPQASIPSPKRRCNRQQRKPLVNNKVHHPSYKAPTAQRSGSMKERREAMETGKKYHNLYFSSSLYRIDEVDEKGLE